MSPITHLLASWVVAAKTNDNLRDVRLVTLAGVLPDADGFGLVVDFANQALGRAESDYYHQYHHWLTHGLAGAIVISFLMACFAQRRWRVFLLAFLVFHLHLLCDLIGSRGPSPQDLWPIFYLAPLRQVPMWIWTHQWQLDGWQNRIISVTLFGIALWMAARRGDSFVGVFNRRLDRTVAGVLQKWRFALGGKGAVSALKKTN